MVEDFKFTLATAPLLYDKLTRFQGELINRLWDDYILTGQQFVRVRVSTEIDKSLLGGKLIEDHIKPLEDAILRRTNIGETGETIVLSIHGALLTRDREKIFELLVLLLNFVKSEHSKSGARTQFDHNGFAVWALSELADASKIDSLLLIRVLMIGMPSRMPFTATVNNPTSPTSAWSLTINPSIEELHIAGDSGAYLEKLLSNGFYPAQLLREQLENSEPSVIVNQEPPPQHDSMDSGTLAFSRWTGTSTESVAATDLLGREKITDALYKLLTEREDDKPFAIGLFGKWGAGKSSQVDFLKSRLQQSNGQEFIVADFNAWHNEKASNLPAMLAQAVVDGLTADMGMPQKAWLAIQLAGRRHLPPGGQAKHGRIVTFALRGIEFLPYIILPITVFVALLLPPFIHWSVAAIGFVVTACIDGYQFARSHLTQLFRRIDAKKAASLLSLPDYVSHRGLMLDIHRTLKDLCELCLTPKNKPHRYLLIVVDDLDRCAITAVKEVFDAIRLVTDIPRVVTLVAIDERIAYSAIREHYSKLVSEERPDYLIARDHLAKVLQVSVAIPEMDQSGVENYVNSLFGQTDRRDTDEARAGNAPAAEERTGALTAEGELPNDRAHQHEEVRDVPPPMPTNDNKEASNSEIATRFLPEEHALFTELSQTYRFSPRLLRRLYLSWKLLKSLYLGPVYSYKEVEMPLHHLFWREWLNHLPTEHAVPFQRWLTDTPGAVLPMEIANKTKDYQRVYSFVSLKFKPRWNRDMLHLDKTVRDVLLPPCVGEQNQPA